jgi:hypothetical protein
MIAELAEVDNINTLAKTSFYLATHVRTLLPEPAMDLEVCYEERRRSELRNVRFP